MKCRQCGTEIAEKALVCYRCGTAVSEPAFGPPAQGRAKHRVRPRTIILLAGGGLAALVVTLAQAC